jgi:hypothetical protein
MRLLPCFEEIILVRALDPATIIRNSLEADVMAPNMGVQRPKMQSRGTVHDGVEGGFCRNPK